MAHKFIHKLIAHCLMDCACAKACPGASTSLRYTKSTASSKACCLPRPPVCS